MTAVLIHTRPILKAEWDPMCSRLALCCKDDKIIYFWSPEGVSHFEVPLPKEEEKKNTKMRRINSVVDLMWIRNDEEDEKNSSSRLVVMLSGGYLCGVGNL